MQEKMYRKIPEDLRPRADVCIVRARLLGHREIVVLETGGESFEWMAWHTHIANCENWLDNEEDKRRA